MGSILDNYIKVKNIIKSSAEKVGKIENDITLVAVSKTQPLDKILSLYCCGARIFGESRVQESLDKISNLNKSDIMFHFIGRLQTNKVKNVVGNFDLIHSVDRISLLQAINKSAYNKNIVQDILIQINLAEEKQKGGVDIKNLDELFFTSIHLNNINLKGFMFIPPFLDNPENNRHLFRDMNKLFYSYRKKYDMSVLSMGMSDDFHIAIEEGATHVRVGTALFGRR